MATDLTPAHEPIATTSRSVKHGLLDEFAQRYYRPLLSFFRRRTRNTTDVQDLVQQVFLRLAQYRDLCQVQNPDGFIFQTAANILKDHYRYQALHKDYYDEYAPSAGTEADFGPERIVGGRETLARLVDALRELPERTRDVFVLRCFEGLKHSEIAQLQGVSTRAIEKHVAKALAHLCSLVDPDAGDSL